MKKVKIILLFFAFIIAMFLLFWKSTFMVHTKHDTTLFLVYICVLCIVTISLLVVKSNKYLYIVSIVLCIGTLVMLVLYKNWNQRGYNIDVDSVKSIVYTYQDDSVKGGYDLYDVDYTNEKDAIIKKYNAAKCVKNWTDLGEVGTSLKTIYIELEDGTLISIDSSGGILKTNKDKGSSVQYRTEFGIENFLE